MHSLQKNGRQLAYRN